MNNNKINENNSTENYSDIDMQNSKYADTTGTDVSSTLIFTIFILIAMWLLSRYLG